MSSDFSSLQINSKRLQARFDELSNIGATPDGGAHRPAFSVSHTDARRWFLAKAQEAGLETRIDGAGNHSVFLRCGIEHGPTLLLGSHLDSVPHGGRFDGALGVLAALEVLETVRENKLQMEMHLEAIDFTDEEGRFVGFLGSQALTGTLSEELLRHPGESFNAFQRALADTGLSKKSLLGAARDTSGIAGYLELHVEQGRRLIDEGYEIGIVTSIVGIRSFKITFQGRADHAGTTAMHQRLDAAQGASAFTLAIRESIMKDFPDGVATVGNMIFEPGAFNVVPKTVTVSLEFRADKEDKLDAMQESLLHQASVAGERFGLSVETERVERSTPVHMDRKVQEIITEACNELGLKYTLLPSGAGHDAQIMARVCPAGMIFVPSVDGFSHSAREYTRWEDCVNGVNVLLHAALKMAHG